MGNSLCGCYSNRDKDKNDEYVQVLEYLTQYFKENPKSRMAFIYLSKEKLWSFMEKLTSIVKHIKSLSGHIFVPTSISNNPMNID